MWFVSDIAERLGDIGDYFWDAKEVVKDWWSPFDELYIPLWYIADGFYRLSSRFWSFDEWLDELVAEIANSLTLENAYLYFKDYFDKAVDAWNWVKYAFSNVWSIIDYYWESAKDTVLGWVAIATEGLDDLRVAWDTFWTITWPQWTAQLSLLASDWSNFVTQKLPTLFDISYAEEWWKGKFSDVTKAIDDAFIERESWWAGWQDWRDKVSEFFTDPWEFLLNRFADWFLGPEE